MAVFRTRCLVLLSYPVFRRRRSGPKFKASFQQRSFDKSTPDGREHVVVLDADQVTANVVEYRPIYVNGDVSKPGVQAYRPLMTVRQAVALCGGYEIMRFRMNNPFLKSADFRSDYKSLWTDFAKERVHIWRLRTELGEGDNLDQKGLPDGAATCVHNLADHTLGGRTTEEAPRELSAREGVSSKRRQAG